MGSKATQTQTLPQSGCWSSVSSGADEDSFFYKGPQLIQLTFCQVEVFQQFFQNFFTVLAGPLQDALNGVFVNPFDAGATTQADSFS